MTLLAVGFALAFGAGAANAPGALDLSAGARKVVANKPVSACNAAAKSALDSVLQDSTEVGGDTGEWQGYAPQDASAGGSPAAAAIICTDLGPGGYIATITCTAQVPPNADSAAALCTKLSAAFDAKAGGS